MICYCKYLNLNLTIVDICKEKISLFRSFRAFTAVRCLNNIIVIYLPHSILPCTYILIHLNENKKTYQYTRQY